MHVTQAFHLLALQNPLIVQKHLSCLPGVASSCLWVQLGYVFWRVTSTPHPQSQDRETPTTGEGDSGQRAELCLIGLINALPLPPPDLCDLLMQKSNSHWQQPILAWKPQISFWENLMKLFILIPKSVGKTPPHTPPPSPWLKDFNFHLVGDGGGGCDARAWMDMFNVSQGRAVLLSRMLHPYFPIGTVHMHSTDFSEKLNQWEL